MLGLQCVAPLLAARRMMIIRHMHIDPNDSHAVRESHLNPVRNVAVVGLINDAGDLLLVRTRRFPDRWQPIAGGIEHSDASPQHAIARELQEETGIRLQPDDFRFILMTPYDFGEGEVHFFIAQLPNNASPVFHAEEIHEWAWYPLTATNGLRMFPATERFLEHLVHEIQSGR